MQNADSTLHDFVLKLLTEAPCRQAFDLDPVAALHDAGLSDVSPQDVVDAIPLALDFASANGGDFNVGGEVGGAFGEFEAGGSFSGGTDGLAGGGSVETPFGGGGLRAEGGTDGNLDIQAGVGVPDQAGALLDVTASPTGGLSLSSSFGSAFGGGGFDLNLGLDGVSGGGGFDLEGPDALGRGGDLVTGTVASYLTDGADSLTGALTDHAGALSGGLDTVDGLVNDGASQLSDTVQDPTSIDVPTISPSGLPELPVDLPVGDLPAMPELPGLPGLPETPGLPGLPGLGDLPVDLPELPVQLPELPGLPEAPGLPSVPGVTDVVGGVTGNVPVVSDLTDGLGEGLLGH